MKVDLGKMTAEETAELVRDAIPLLTEEGQWDAFRDLVGQLGVESALDEVERMAEKAEESKPPEDEPA